MTLLPWLATAFAAAPCTQAVPPSRITSALDEALVSFAVMEQEAFERAADDAVASLACVREPVTVDLAAALHRVQGLRLLVTGAEEPARLALEASARLVPGHQLSQTIAPDGGKIAVAWAAASQAGPMARVALPDGVDARVDGSPASDRPSAGPYVLQRVTEDGLASSYVASGWPSEPVVPPPAPAPEPVVSAPMPSPEPAPMPEPVASSDGGNKVLLWSGVAAGGVAAGLYGTSAVTRLSYDQNPTDGARSVTNGTYFASVGTAVLSGVLFTTFFATR